MIQSGGEEETRLIEEHQPIFNDSKKPRVQAVILERRYAYLQSTGIEGLYRNDEERTAHEREYWWLHLQNQAFNRRVIEEASRVLQ
jgi:hypothetical protein